jgi:hypothetical protein
MKSGIIAGLLTACIGLSLYLFKAEKPSEQPDAAPAIALTVSARSAPPAPVVLPEVVEVIDLDALLDTPPRPVAGEPFDAPRALPPLSTSSVPERIPPAMD